MAIRAWMDGDLRLALRLLQWAQPDLQQATANATNADSPQPNPQDDSDWAFQAA